MPRMKVSCWMEMQRSFNNSWWTGDVICSTRKPRGLTSPFMLYVFISVAPLLHPFSWFPSTPQRDTPSSVASHLAASPFIDMLSLSFQIVRRSLHLLRITSFSSVRIHKYRYYIQSLVPPDGPRPMIAEQRFYQEVGGSQSRVQGPPRGPVVTLWKNAEYWNFTQLNIWDMKSDKVWSLTLNTKY